MKNIDLKSPDPPKGERWKETQEEINEIIDQIKMLISQGLAPEVAVKKIKSKWKKIKTSGAVDRVWKKYIFPIFNNGEFGAE